MEAVVPWNELVDLIEPQYPRTSSKDGRPPYPLETILRIHLLQQWYDLSDPSMEDALIEVATMRRLARIALVTDRLRSRSVSSKKLETHLQQDKLPFRRAASQSGRGEKIYAWN
jgi:hypothetical protein